MIYTDLKKKTKKNHLFHFSSLWEFPLRLASFTVSLSHHTHGAEQGTNRSITCNATCRRQRQMSESRDKVSVFVKRMQNLATVDASSCWRSTSSSPAVTACGSFLRVFTTHNPHCCYAWVWLCWTASTKITTVITVNKDWNITNIHIYMIC